MITIIIYLMSMDQSNIYLHTAHDNHAAVNAVGTAKQRDWRLEYQHAAEPCLLLKRRCGRTVRTWQRGQAVAILRHPRCHNLLCLPSLCHGRSISLDKTQAQTLLMIAACCSLNENLN